jgi:hypothetical protein
MSSFKLSYKSKSKNNIKQKMVNKISKKPLKYYWDRFPDQNEYLLNLSR